MVARLLSAGARRLRPTIGWTAFVLALVAVLASALGVVRARWVDGDEMLVYVALVSALLNAILAHTALRAHWAALISAGSGLLYVSQSLARFIPPPLRATIELARGAQWLWMRTVHSGGQLDLIPPTLPLWSQSGTRLLTLGERLSSWANTLVTGQSDQNPVAFLFVAGLIVWGGAAWAMWITMRRGQAVLAMLPLGLGLSVSAYLGGGTIGYLATFACSVLMLLPILNLSWQERRWEDAGIDYSTEIRFDVWQVTVLFAIAALILALITPSISIPRLLIAFWDVASRPMQTLEDAVLRFFGNVEPVPQPQIPVPGQGEGAQPPPGASLPRAHLLGGSAGKSNEVVMVVCTDSPPPPPEELLMEGLAAPGPRYYWKGITYDLYTGQRWTNAASRTVEVPAYEPVIQSVVTPALVLEQRFLIQAPHGRTLYAAAEAARVDQRVESRQRTAGDLIGLESQIDDYVVYSEIPQASVRQLIDQSQPGQDRTHISPTLVLPVYPPDLLDRYLQLPSTLPERVPALAHEIVAGVDSTYGQALAIERYLRQFPYDLDVATPPPGRDVVDYFVFDAQRGYCDYYASAFVVLARAAGIPARLAIGFVTGAYDEGLGCHVVAERDAHSWPEVYFGEHGWIAFEPTAAYATLVRPDDPIRPTALNPSIQPPPDRPWDVVLREWWRRMRQSGRNDVTRAAALAAGVTATLLLLAWMIARAVRAHRHRRLPPVLGIAVCYAEMCRLGQELGARRQPQDTPAEYARVLSAVLHTRVARWPWSTPELMSQQAEAAHDTIRLSQAYQRASYFPQSISAQERARIDQLWQSLQRRMRWLAMTSRAPSRPHV